MAYSEQTDWAKDWHGEALRRRGIGFAVALLLEALFILAILSLSLRSAGPAAGKYGLSTFSLEAESESKSADKSEAETPVTKPQREFTPPSPKPLLPPLIAVKTPPPSDDFIKLSKSELDAMDLSKTPASGSSDAGEAKGAGQGNKGMMGPGAGPGGAQLYPVAWLREPYDAELAPYLAVVKRVPPGASADIACRMAAHNRVENCQIIGENPRGTGLAQALRRAAWQFLVKPPRIDNRPQLGVWVRIHFDFGVKVVDEEAPASR